MICVIVQWKPRLLMLLLPPPFSVTADSFFLTPTGVPTRSWSSVDPFQRFRFFCVLPVRRIDFLAVLNVSWPQRSRLRSCISSIVFHRYLGDCGAGVAFHYASSHKVLRFGLCISSISSDGPLRGSGESSSIRPLSRFHPGRRNESTPPIVSIHKLEINSGHVDSPTLLPSETQVSWRSSVTNQRRSGAD